MKNSRWKRRRVGRERECNEVDGDGVEEGENEEGESVVEDGVGGWLGWVRGVIVPSCSF